MLVFTNAVNFFFQNASSHTFMIRFFSYLTHIIPRGVPHLACARLGDLAIFGDLATYSIFKIKMVLHIVTLVINCYVTVAASTQHKVSVNHMRVRMSEKISLQCDVYTAFCEL